MSDFQNQDNQFEEFEESPGSQPPPARGNRSFMIAIGVIGAIFVIALIILGITLLTRSTQQAGQTRAEADRIATQNFSTAAAATADQLRLAALQQTLEAAAKAPPPTTAPSATVEPTAAGATPTSVIAIPTASSTPTATISAEMAQTATSSAATQFAQGTKTLGAGGFRGTGYPPAGSGTLAPGTPQPTPTGLPQTGFADEVGLPGLAGLAVLLVIVVILARRTRLSTR